MERRSVGKKRMRMKKSSRSDADLYREMLRIRVFEERLLEMFPSGQIYGTTHTYIGQEANAVGVLATLRAGDVVVSNHRCHGHFLAYGGSMQALAAELLGRETGICGGRGGSQHIKWKNFFANGILGGTVPIAVGMAYAENATKRDTLVYTFIGDGTLGEGVVYESLNMASLWNLPIFFIVENNHYAQSTPVEMNLAGDMCARFEAFGITTTEQEACDVLEIMQLAEDISNSIRTGKSPQALILHTYRFAPHSKGDDTRDPDEIARYRARDPLQAHAARLAQKVKDEIETAVADEVERAYLRAENGPHPAPESLSLPLEEIS
jgi:TPP-dependent pyruvate/acetoin dehydrogenase alpha subunit